MVDPVQVSDLGVVTLEDGGVWLRRGGRRVEIALPPGANPELVAVAGTVGVAPVPEGALVVFDLRSGVELRQVSLGEYDPVNLDGLAVSPAGDVAATVPAGDGTGVLVWAPAGASGVQVLARGASRLGRVAVAGGRVAYVTGAKLREGVRAVVVDPAGPREVLRGPPVYDVTSLSFDGAWLGLLDAVVPVRRLGLGVHAAGRAVRAHRGRGGTAARRRPGARGVHQRAHARVPRARGREDGLRAPGSGARDQRTAGSVAGSNRRPGRANAPRPLGIA